MQKPQSSAVSRQPSVVSRNGKFMKIDYED
jgi:hypothetical protein